MIVLNKNEYGDTIAWLPCGNGFVIRNKKKLEEVIIPKYFSKNSKFHSFVRRLRRWKFRSIRYREDDKHKTAYHNPLFVKGNFSSCLAIIPLLQIQYSKNNMRSLNDESRSVNQNSVPDSSLTTVTEGSVKRHSVREPQQGQDSDDRAAVAPSTCVVNDQQWNCYHSFQSPALHSHTHSNLPQCHENYGHQLPYWTIPSVATRTTPNHEYNSLHPLYAYGNYQARNSGATGQVPYNNSGIDRNNEFARNVMAMTNLNTSHPGVWDIDTPPGAKISVPLPPTERVAPIETARERPMGSFLVEPTMIFEPTSSAGNCGFGNSDHGTVESTNIWMNAGNDGAVSHLPTCEAIKNSSPQELARLLFSSVLSNDGDSV